MKRIIASEQRSPGVVRVASSTLRTSSALGAIVAILVASPVFAQAANNSDSGVTEIIVTAQKRAQNLQDVPVAITALNAQALQVNRVQSVNDLNGLAPGLMVREDPGGNASPSFSMRGVFATAAVASQDREISVYLDGVYVAGTRGSVFDLPDVERIEVLRGPQGTLFGRNATAGAISVVTRDPFGKFGIRQDITVGNYAQFRSRTTVDTPQIGPFSAYFTYVHDKRRGDVRNLGAGVCFDRTSPFTNLGVTCSPQYLGSKDSDGYYAAVKFEPSDNFEMIYKFDKTDTNETPTARTSVAINANSPVGGLLQTLLNAQTPGFTPYGPITLDPENKRPDAVNNSWTMAGYVKASGHSVTSTWNAADNLSFKNITAYRETRTIGIQSFTGLDGLAFTPAAAVAIGAPAAAGQNQYFETYGGNQSSRANQISSETQLNYHSKLLTLTVGGLWYHSFETDDGLAGMAATFAFTPLPTQLPLGNIETSSSKTTSLAAYTQAEVHLSPQFDLVAGGRITQDKKSGDLITGGVFVGSRTGTGTIVGATGSPFQFNKTKPTFSIGLNYKPDRDILVYGKYSTAFLSGGAVGTIVFQPETVSAEEVGVKSELFDRKLRINLAAFNAVYEHQQAPVSGTVVNIGGVNQGALGVVVIDNGQLKSYGFELEVSAAPTQGVVIGGSLAYDHTLLTSPNPVLAQGFAYRETGVVPWTGMLYAQYQTQPLFDDATLFFRLDANYQGRYRAISDPNIAVDIPAFAPYEFSPSRWILNGRVVLQNVEVGPLTGEVAGWVRNLTNNRDVLYQLQFGTFQIDSSYQAARTFGLDLTLKFK